MYRRVITTVVFVDGTAQSTAQDYVFDAPTDRWLVASNPYEYDGPGVAPAKSGGGSPGDSGDARGGEAVGERLALVLKLVGRKKRGVSSSISCMHAVHMPTHLHFYARKKGNQQLSSALAWDTGPEHDTSGPPSGDFGR